MHRSTFDTKYSKENVNISFCNIKLIRKTSQTTNILKELKRWAAKTEGPKTVFVYTASAVFLKAVYTLKKTYTDLIVCDIIADLPGLTNLSSKKSFFLKKYEKRMEKASHLYMDSVDYFVLLTKQMAEYLKIQKPFCVMEGISTEFASPPKAKETGVKTIFYSGTLHKRFGVLNLLNAFISIPNKDYRLQICGVGDCEENIVQAALEDSRIDFLGRLPRNEVLTLQKNATVLVNPRQNNEEFTKYSFPSKNLEYLSSGIPVIAYKLDGIPDDYDPYMHYVRNDSVEALTEKILEVCEMTEEQRTLNGYAAWKYVSENKNEITQTKKIVEMLSV